MATADIQPDADERRAFTSAKLDWIDALAADPRVSARTFRVGFAIVQRVNMKSGDAFISDAALRNYTGQMPLRCIQRARSELRELGWLAWRRTQSANVYRPLSPNVANIEDYVTLKREELQEAREAKKSVPPRVANPKCPDAPQVAVSDSPQVAGSDSPRVADIHLGSTRSGLHRSLKEGLPSTNLEQGRGCAPERSAASPTDGTGLKSLGSVIADMGLSEWTSLERGRFILKRIRHF